MRLDYGPCSKCGIDGFALAPSSGMRSPFLCEEHMRKLWAVALGIDHGDGDVEVSSTMVVEPEKP